MRSTAAAATFAFRPVQHTSIASLGAFAYHQSVNVAAPHHPSTAHRRSDDAAPATDGVDANSRGAFHRSVALSNDDSRAAGVSDDRNCAVTVTCGARLRSLQHRSYVEPKPDSGSSPAKARRAAKDDSAATRRAAKSVGAAVHGPIRHHSVDCQRFGAVFGAHGAVGGRRRRLVPYVALDVPRTASADDAPSQSKPSKSSNSSDAPATSADTVRGEADAERAASDRHRPAEREHYAVHTASESTATLAPDVAADAPAAARRVRNGAVSDDEPAGTNFVLHRQQQRQCHRQQLKQQVKSKSLSVSRKRCGIKCRV